MQKNDAEKEASSPAIKTQMDNEKYNKASQSQAKVPTIITQFWIRADHSHNPLLIQRPRTDLGRTSGKNHSDKIGRAHV